MMPQNVKTLSQLHEKIRDFGIDGMSRTRDGENLISCLTPRSGSLVITTQRQLNQFPSAELLHADATYKVVPRVFMEEGRTQLFTIHERWGCNLGFFSLIEISSVRITHRTKSFHLIHEALTGVSSSLYRLEWSQVP